MNSFQLKVVPILLQTVVINIKLSIAVGIIVVLLLYNSATDSAAVVMEQTILLLFV